MEFNLIANPWKFADIAELMGEDIKGVCIMDAALKSVVAVKRLMKDLGMPLTLKEVGVKRDDIQFFMDDYKNILPAMQAMNPRDMSEDELRLLLERAL